MAIHLSMRDPWKPTPGTDEVVFQWVVREMEHMLHTSVSICSGQLTHQPTSLFGIDALLTYVHQSQNLRPIATMRTLLLQTSFIYSNDFEKCSHFLRVDKEKVALFVHQYADYRRVSQFPFISQIQVPLNLYDSEVHMEDLIRHPDYVTKIKKRMKMNRRPRHCDSPFPQAQYHSDNKI